MRLFLLINILIITSVIQSVACGFPELSGETFFNANIEVSGHTISGIMVIKKDEQKKNRYRILFTTIAGPKLMDMYISTDGYEILYVVKKLNKRIILRMFQTDFALISGLYLSGENKNCENGNCTIKLSKKKSAHYSFDNENRIINAEYRGKGKILFEVVYTYNQDIIETIFLQHHNFNMKITLKSITQ
jgi:hypothetical protein